MLPKSVKQPKKAITPEHFENLLGEIPERYRILVLVAIETDARWGEVAALRPIGVDLDNGEIHIRRVVLEVSSKITGAASVWSIRDYPKDNEHRTIRIGDQSCQDVREYLMATGKRGESLLCPAVPDRGSRATCSAQADPDHPAVPGRLPDADDRALAAFQSVRSRKS